MKTRSLTIRLPESLYAEAEARAGAGTKTDVVVNALSQAWGIEVKTALPPSMSFAEVVTEVEKLKRIVESLQQQNIVCQPAKKTTKKSLKEKPEAVNLPLLIEEKKDAPDHEMPEGSQRMKSSELIKILGKENPSKDWQKSLESYRKNKRGREKNTVGKCLFKYIKDPERKRGEEHLFWVKYPI